MFACTAVYILRIEFTVFYLKFLDVHMFSFCERKLFYNLPFVSKYHVFILSFYVYVFTD